MRFYAVDPAMKFASPYLFCGNNPIMYVDEDGEWAFLIPIVAGAVINVVTNDGIKQETISIYNELSGHAFATDYEYNYPNPYDQSDQYLNSLI